MIIQSFFLNNGKTFAIFSFSGNIPVNNDWLIIKVKGCRKAGAKYFKSLTEIPSWPDDVLVCKYCITLSKLDSSISWKSNDVNIVLFKYTWKVFSRIWRAFLVRDGPIFTKKLLKLSAILWGSFSCLPFRIMAFMPFLWCLVLHIISFITDQVFFMLDLLSSSLEL